jgi:hypothetical protein
MSWFSLLYVSIIIISHEVIQSRGPSPTLSGSRHHAGHLVRHQWQTPVILAIGRQRLGRVQFKVSLGKKFTRPHLDHKNRVQYVCVSCQLQGRLSSGGLWFNVSLGTKFVRLQLNRKRWVWWDGPVIPAMGESINRKNPIQASPGINARHYLKNNQSKRARAWLKPPVS